LHWQPREPPLIVVDGSVVPGRWRPSGGPALRRLDLDPDTARFFGYPAGQAAAMPGSHYDGGTRARGSLRAWRARGRQLNLAIRRSPDGEAVGWAELRRTAQQASNLIMDLGEYGAPGQVHDPRSRLELHGCVRRGPR
jgi:hypothetical protein